MRLKAVRNALIHTQSCPFTGSCRFQVGFSDSVLTTVLYRHSQEKRRKNNMYVILDLSFQLTNYYFLIFSHVKQFYNNRTVEHLAIKSCLERI